MISCILIDLDETIVSYEDPHILSLKNVYLKFFIEFFDSFEKFLKVYNNNKKNIHIRLHGVASSHSRFLYFKLLCENLEISYDTLLKIDEYYWNILLENLTIKDGIVELLTFFKKRNIKICLITDFISVYQFKKLEKFKLLNYFDEIITSEEVGIEKPHPFVFQWAMSKLKLKPGQIMMIGDNFERDIQSSINENIFACHYVFQNDPIFKIYGNYLVYQNHRDLLTFFVNLYNGIDKLISIGKIVGLDEDIVQAGGGNISIKIDNSEINSDDLDESSSGDNGNLNLILVKSSGYNLSEITEYDGYCTFLLNDLKSRIYNGEDEIDDSRTWIKRGNPSIETHFHAIINKKYIIHTHPNLLLPLFNESKLKSNLIPYITPGVEISDYLIKNNKLNDNSENKYLYLENHGVILSTDHLIDIYEMKKYLWNIFEINGESVELMQISEKIKNKFNIINLVAKVLQYQINYNDIVNTYPCTPDLAVYCGYPILLINDADIEQLKSEQLQKHVKIIIYNNKYIFYISDSLKKAKQIESVFLDYLKMLKMNNNKSIKKLLEIEIEKLFSWTKETRRLNVQ